MAITLQSSSPGNQGEDKTFVGPGMQKTNFFLNTRIKYEAFLFHFVFSNVENIVTLSWFYWQSKYYSDSKPAVFL